MVDIPFPKSSQPGARPGSGAGRLINCYWVEDGPASEFRVCAGLSQFAETSLSGFRGAIDINGVLYAAVGTKVIKVTTSGTVTQLTGTLPGSDNVTFARNNRSGGPDAVCVASAGTYSITSTDVTTFADTDLPAVNSCASLAGYILFTTSAGQFWATDLNAVTVSSTSFASAEANPDSASRVIVKGQQAYVFGPASTEIWYNVAASPFPLARQEVLYDGLIGQWAVAGAQDGWSGPLIFVSQDGVVKALQGYQSTRVSNADVERAIKDVSDKSTLVASVYVVNGVPFWNLSSATWTWELNVATGNWHERTSSSLTRWRGVGAVQFNGNWVCGDNQSTKILTIDASTYTEMGSALAMTLESGPVKDFPARIICDAAFFDWSTGVGLGTGSADATDPKCSIQWSFDGGATWSPSAVESVIGAQGNYAKRVRVNRIGLSTGHGVRFRVASSSPVWRALRGGRAVIRGARAA